MKKEEIHLWDLKRILFGQSPPEFLLEVFIRTLIIYLSVIIIGRFLGKRMNGQLSIIEKSVMVMMGAILAVPMQAPERGIVQGIILLLGILLLLRGINWLAFENKRLERLVHGGTALLIKNGELQLDALRKTKISKQQLYAILRSKEVYQLGSVKRLYLEPYGDFSLYREKNDKPGLSVLPPNDNELTDNLNSTPEKVCCNCGRVVAAPKAANACPNCGNTEWTSAILK
jgi:uncharacterized membrane protein YcaP (DUF421 family)